MNNSDSSDSDDRSAPTNQVKPIQIKCPQCGLLTVYSNKNPSRPFCSDRCKLIDLGQWADQSYKIPSTSVSIDTSQDMDDADELEPKD